MKVSYQWLKEFVDVQASPQELADALTNAGVAVETIESVGADSILDLDLTTNRPDCLSHWGVAREAAVLYRRKLKGIETRLDESQKTAAASASVEITAPQLCYRYSARVIRGVKVASSPAWLSERLEALGIRSINNVADITNYVLMEMGHPLHAFDLSMLEGSKIVVREATDDELLVTIDGEERKLAAGMLVIADQRKPVALAGIMGGLESEIGVSTRDVLLESAWFEPISIRKTSKQLGMHTEASHRFERGADISATIPTLDRAASLIQQLAGGEVLRGVIDVFPRQIRREPVTLRKSRVEQIMGLEMEPSVVEDILKRLDFQILKKLEEGWRIGLPTSRLDVEREIDLIEEVARHYGYDKIPSTLPLWAGEAHRRPEHSRERLLKERLLHLGYSETFTYSFVDKAETSKFHPLVPIPLLNPLSSEMGVMRTSLLPGLLSSLLRNYNRGMRNARLYEMGRVFHQDNGQTQEDEILGIIATGNCQEKSIHGDQRMLNFFDLKGDLEVLLEAMSLSAGEVEFCPPAERGLGYYHPGAVAEVRGRGERLGVFGQLHPKVCEQYKIKQPVFVAELTPASWFALKEKDKTFSEIPKFPAIQRDLSVVVEKGVNYGRIEAIVRGAGIAEVQKVYPFDLYSSENLPVGKKAVAFSIVYQAMDRTLVEEEVNRYQEAVVRLLKDKLGAQLRS